MDELKLPEQLKGPWEHVLILTYGVDVPFFENALWGQFSARCRNKIILADGRRYLESCTTYARGGLVRHLNQRYITEGILAPRAAHAKAILLTTPEQGRLLVGSGNLSWQGYASGGELFTHYEYSSEDPQSINAFLAMRDLVDGLRERQYISAPAVRRIRHLWEQTPWLFQPPQGQEWPVRHNLKHSFLDQLQQAVGDEPVEEMWVLSPFYDRDAVALERLLTAFEPRQTILLLQTSYTSVDPVALQRVLDHFGTRCQVRPFNTGSDSLYVHAKMILLKSQSRTICLQGSPNLSQVAMLLTVPQGNIELANLLTGPRHAFDGILDALNIETAATTLAGLDLRFQPDQTSVKEAPEEWRLTGGEWRDNRLCLRFQGTAPDLHRALLVVAQHTFLVDVHRREPHRLELRLSAEAVGLLSRPVPVAIRWGEGEGALTTNPVFVCNRVALDAALEIAPEGKTLDRLGDLDLDDAEFERLLAELDAALVLDRRSIWTLAGKTVPSTIDEDDEALRLDYADVDYDMLRQHPKLLQYTRGKIGGAGATRSRLQIILSSITDHFRGLLDVAAIAKVMEGAFAGPEGDQAENGDEREQKEKKQKRQSQVRRLRRILKSFVRRYRRGIRSPDFQELAGFEVMAQNYVIFSYLLWRLLIKDWVEPEFIIDSLLQTWTFFWGYGSQKGYFEGLDQEERVQVLQLIQGDQHADAVLVASLYYSARMTRLEHWEEPRFTLRDFWRDMICHSPFELTAQVLENAWHILADLFPYEPPLPGVIVEELEQLARFETQSSFLRAVEKRGGYLRSSCRFEKVKVYRQTLGRSDTVDCLTVQVDDALPSKDATVPLLQAWMRFTDRDYYRICTANGNRILFYEKMEKEGLYYAKDLGSEEIAVGQVEPEAAVWDVPLARLRTLAGHVEEGLGFAVREPSAAPVGESVSRTRQ